MRVKLKPSIKERSIKAFLDLAIICALTNGPMTGYELNIYFVEKFKILVGPSIIYSKLLIMERKGWIKSTQNRTARRYTLTSQGQEIANDLNNLAQEIQEYTKLFLKVQETDKQNPLNEIINC
jgi:DNA-binding PadR family transcriptional regulator